MLKMKKKIGKTIKLLTNGRLHCVCGILNQGKDLRLKNTTRKSPSN